MLGLMHRIRRVILSPWTTLVSVALGALLMLGGALLSGTLHVITAAHITFVQFGDTFMVGSQRGTIIQSTRIWQVAVVLAVPGMAWAVWFLIHSDSKKR